jgi:hypothetical protein
MYQFEIFYQHFKALYPCFPTLPQSAFGGTETQFIGAKGNDCWPIV